MIIYGSKATHVATENLPGKCPGCGTQKSIALSVFQKYAHVFWIPFFPIGKTGVTECSHCKQVLELKELSPEIKEEYVRIKSQSKTPVWTFAGLAVLAVVISLGVVRSNQKDEKNAVLIQSPIAGDIFEVNKGDKQYTLYKVDRVSGDTVFVLFSEFETNKATGLNDIKSKGNEAYIPEPMPLTKQELINMLKEGIIINIDRQE